MARLVLLSFDDNAEAEAYVASLQTTKSMVAVPEGEEGKYKIVEMSPKVLGMYGVPVTYCKHERYKGRDTDQTARGATLGWFVQRCCNRPREEREQYPNNLLAGPNDTRTESEKRPTVFIQSPERVTRSGKWNGSQIV